MLLSFWIRHECDSVLLLHQQCDGVSGVRHDFFCVSEYQQNVSVFQDVGRRYYVIFDKENTTIHGKHDLKWNASCISKVLGDL